MVNRKMVMAVLVAVLIVWVSVIDVSAVEVQKVNINTASAGELTRLKGIGPSIAARIIAYREKSGLFKQPEDLMQVPGIGKKVFAANQELIVVHDQQSKKE